MVARLTEPATPESIEEVIKAAQERLGREIREGIEAAKRMEGVIAQAEAQGESKH